MTAASFYNQFIQPYPRVAQRHLRFRLNRSSKHWEVMVDESWRVYLLGGFTLPITIPTVSISSSGRVSIETTRAGGGRRP
jgi:hypothetical protein